MSQILDPDALATTLIALPTDQRSDWLDTHQSLLSLELITALKRRSDALLLSDPQAAEHITTIALEVAQRLPNLPLAMSLACWARGNWDNYHAPGDAVARYQQALADYRAAGEYLSVARLLSNLIAPLTECGAFDQAQQAYAEAETIFADMGEDAAFYLLAMEQNYGLLLHSQGLFSEALAMHDRALERAYRFDPTDVAEVQVNRILTLGMLGRLAEGEAALYVERAVAADHQQALTVARIDMNLGELYTALGRPADALSHFDTALDGFTALGNQMEVGTLRLLEASLFERIGALREACRSYTHARTQLTASELMPLVGESLVRHAAASRRYGEYAEARHLLARADSLWLQLDQPLWRLRVVLEQAALALDQDDADTAMTLLQSLPTTGEHVAMEIERQMLTGAALARHWQATGDPSHRDQARRCYNQALASAQALDDRWMSRHALAGLGQLALHDDPDSACALLEQAVACDESLRQSLSVEELKAGFQTQADDLLPSLIRLAVDQGQPMRALVYAWQAKGGALRDLLYATSAERRLSPADRAALDHARQQLASQRWCFARESGAGPEQPREASDPAIRKLENQLAALRRRLNHQMSDASAVPSGAPAERLADMDADILIEYVRCGDDILALCADRKGDCQAIWLTTVETTFDLLDMIKLSFEHVVTLSFDQLSRQRERWLAECIPALRECYDLLIAPLNLPPGARLLIAPCPPLTMLPFAALWDGQHYLVEQHTIELTPSGALLAARPPTVPLGVPLLIASSAEGALGSAQVEVAAICAALPDSVSLVDDPQALIYLSNLTQPPRILHLAAHTILREDLPIFSALQLSGGVLAVEQCYDLPLAGTELVTLSACTTASGMESGGALLAFQSAFFVAGVRRVLSSLWAVGDASTAAWMGRFYRAIAAGHDPAIALGQTQRSLIADPGLGHPAIWAAFMCSRR